MSTQTHSRLMTLNSAVPTTCSGNWQSSGRALLAAAGLGLFFAPVMAADLRVVVDGGADLLVENRSTSSLAEIGLHPGSGWAIDCPGAPGSGSLARLGSLAGQSQQRCAGEATAAQPRSAVVAAARRADGSAALSHASRTLLLGPSESIVLVAGGAVHNDTDTDGILDAGETIDYHYTLLNLGALDVSSLVTVDEFGAVTCPQTTLAVGASMICTRSYTLTPADQTAGLVINQVDIDGVDTLGRNVGATDVIVSQNLAGRAGVRVFKSPRVADDVDGNGVTSIGDLIRYTFVIKNSGAEALSSVTLFEPDPSRIDTPIVCAATTLAGASFAGNGSGGLGSTDVLLCSADYTVRPSDAAIRQVLNVAEVTAIAPVAGQVIATAASTVVVPVPPVIGVSKALVSNVGIGPGPYTVRFAIVVGNYGTIPLQEVQVEENLRQTFPLPVAFSVVSVAVQGTGAPNPGFNGISDTGLLDPAQSTLVPGDAMTIDLVLSVSPGVLAGPFLNQVIATGRDSINQSVADASTAGMNPDPDGDGIPNENEPTPIIFNVLPPPVNIPSHSPLGLLLLALAVGLAAFRLRLRG